MTDTERYLCGYYYAKRDMRRLLLELDAARRSYEAQMDGLYPGHDFNAIRTKNKQIIKPVERAVELLVDWLATEVSRIEQALIRARCTVDALDALVMGAGLDGREREYVQLRYFEGHSIDKITRAMYYSEGTLKRIRVSALGKLERTTGTITVTRVGSDCDFKRKLEATRQIR